MAAERALAFELLRRDLRVHLLQGHGSNVVQVTEEIEWVIPVLANRRQAFEGRHLLGKQKKISVIRDLIKNKLYIKSIK